MIMLVKFLLGCIIVGVVAVILLMITAINLLNEEMKEYDASGLYDDDVEN